MSYIPMFSVIVPIYNVESYIKNCVESVLSSTFDDFELILIDDGSTDNSLYICSEYEKIDKRVVVISQKNGGATSARKTGASVARGKYIICIDSDDLITKDYFANIFEIVQMYSPDVIVCGYQLFSERKKSVYFNECEEGNYIQVDKQRLVEKLIFDVERKWPNSGSMPNSIWTKIVKTELFCKHVANLDHRIRIGEDLLLSYMILDDCQSIYMSNITDYCYRIDNNCSIMNSFNEKDIDSIELVIRVLEKLIDETRLTAFAIFNFMNRLKILVISSESFVEFKKRYRNIPRNNKFYYYSHRRLTKNASIVERLKLWIIQKEILICIYIYHKFMH